jgi:phosphoserine phosphatase
VLVSSSLRHTLESLKVYLWAEETIGTPLVERRGFIVSRGEGPVCYGPGKLHWAHQWCEMQGIDPADCVAYGDNYSDRFLMEGMGKAVAVRPKRNLRKYARKKGWLIVD